MSNNYSNPASQIPQWFELDILEQYVRAKTINHEIVWIKPDKLQSMLRTYTLNLFNASTKSLQLDEDNIDSICSMFAQFDLENYCKYATSIKGTEVTADKDDIIRCLLYATFNMEDGIVHHAMYIVTPPVKAEDGEPDITCLALCAYTNDDDQAKEINENANFFLNHDSVDIENEESRTYCSRNYSSYAAMYTIVKGLAISVDSDDSVIKSIDAVINQYQTRVAYINFYVLSKVMAETVTEVESRRKKNQFGTANLSENRDDMRGFNDDLCEDDTADDWLDIDDADVIDEDEDDDNEQFFINTEECNGKDSYRKCVSNITNCSTFCDVSDDSTNAISDTTEAYLFGNSEYCHQKCNLYKYCNYGTCNKRRISLCPPLLIENSLSTLSSEEQFIIRHLYGISDARTMTIAQIAHEMYLSSYRVEQIKNRAKRKLRHPIKSREWRNTVLCALYSPLVNDVFSLNNWYEYVLNVFIEWDKVSPYVEMSTFFNEMNTNVEELGLTRKCIEKLSEHHLTCVMDIVYFPHDLFVNHVFPDDVNSLIELYCKLCQWGYGYKVKDYTPPHDVDCFEKHIAEKLHQECMEKGCSEQSKENYIYNYYAVKKLTIEELDLSTRSSYSLKRAGIDTVEDLMNWTKDEMLRIRHLGRKNLEEVIQKLHSLGVSLKETEE